MGNPARPAAALAKVYDYVLSLCHSPIKHPGLLNPLGMRLLWQSALPATAEGESGLLWLQYYFLRGRAKANANAT